jgi:hypothetical protein
MAFEQDISKHPEIGIIGAIIAWIAPYIDVLTQIGQFVAVWVGVVAAAATAYVKIKEAINLRNKK